jgi:hypothetical protein
VEGTHCYRPRLFCSKDRFVDPVSEYAHAHRRCSITGGYVYRGAAIPDLQGAYVYGDFCSGEVFALRREAVAIDREPVVLLKTGMSISSFGRDASGELYVLDHRGGAVFRVVPAR